jgi:hypothetical protein
MRNLGVHWIRWATLALAMAAATAAAQGVEKEGVRLEPGVQVSGAALQLNGAGLRTRVFFKVYVAALYVPQKSDNAATLLAQKGPRRIQISMLRNVDADTFSGALNEGLRNNLSEAQLAGFKPQIEALGAVFQSVGEARKGDTILIDYVPEAGTRIVVNGQARGNAIAGEDFYAALLRVWLGDKPVDADLRKGLLGG